MFPFGAIIGLAGQAASGIMSAINNRKIEAERKAAANRQEAHYEAQAAENPLSRAENRALLAQYDRDAKKQVESARNTGVIMGSTPEYGVAVQDAVAQGRADLMGQISANNQARVDKANENAEKVRAGEEAASLEAKAARNQTYANLAANAASAVGSIADAYGDKGFEVEKGATSNQKTGVKVTGSTPDANEKMETGIAAIKSRLAESPTLTHYDGGQASVNLSKLSTGVGAKVKPQNAANGSKFNPQTGRVMDDSNSIDFVDEMRKRNQTVMFQ